MDNIKEVIVSISNLFLLVSIGEVVCAIVSAMSTVCKHENHVGICFHNLPKKVTSERCEKKKKGVLEREKQRWLPRQTETRLDSVLKSIGYEHLFGARGHRGKGLGLNANQRIEN